MDVVTENPLELLIRKLTQHSPLSDEDKAAILALPVTQRTVEAATYLVREGDRPNHCAIMVSGFAYRQKLTGEGARQIVAIHIPGEAVDFQNMHLDVSDHNVQTLTRARIAVVQRTDFQRLSLERPAIALAINVSNLVEASIFREWIMNVGRRDARTRLTHLLCEFAIRLDAMGLADEYGYELPMTQEQLADAVGLTSVHVNRTLKLMEEAGLITRSKRQVSFPNWERLRQAGDFNARYLHLSEGAEAA